MFVYLHGSPGRAPAAEHVMFITPAAHLEGQEVPATWVNRKNEPISFQIEFVHGRAEVDPDMGRYLVSEGLAFKNPARRETEAAEPGRSSVRRM